MMFLLYYVVCIQRKGMWFGGISGDFMVWEWFEFGIGNKLN